MLKSDFIQNHLLKYVYANFFYENIVGEKKELHRNFNWSEGTSFSYTTFYNDEQNGMVYDISTIMDMKVDDFDYVQMDKVGYFINLFMSRIHILYVKDITKDKADAIIERNLMANEYANKLITKALRIKSIKNC